MGIYLRIMPGVKVRLGRRGVRWAIGPRWLRLHVGAGGTGISTGAGPVTPADRLGLTPTHRAVPSPRRGNGGTPARPARWVTI